MNKCILIFSAIILTILGVCGCSKSPLCWGDDKNKGLIISSLVIDQISCVDPSILPENEYVIEDQNSYMNLLTNIEYCDSSGLPEVDFDKHTLLGQYATGSCEVKLIREVVENPDSDEYVYSIVVRDCGSCQKLRYDMNWVLVPKLPENYRVEFIIKD